MPKAKLKRGELKEQTTVKIPYEHLNPTLQAIIGTPGHFSISHPNLDTIQVNRASRGTAALGVLAVTAAFDNFQYPLTDVHLSNIAFGAGIVALYHVKHSKLIREAHSRLRDTLGKNSVLQTQFEHLYPFHWDSAGVIAETHPVFYVTGRGDLVFKKLTRLEYMRYLDQERWYSKKFGLTPWRWREHLKPPKAPEKVRVAVLAKLREAWARRPTVPEPAFAPAPRPR